MTNTAQVIQTISSGVPLLSMIVSGLIGVSSYIVGFFHGNGKLNVKNVVDDAQKAIDTVQLLAPEAATIATIVGKPDVAASIQAASKALDTVTQIHTDAQAAIASQKTGV